MLALEGGRLMWMLSLAAALASAFVLGVEPNHTTIGFTVPIDASSIDTGIDERDEDLRGEPFFDVARHPRLVFESERVERRGDGYVAKGALTMRGRSKPLDLPFRVTSVDWHEGAPVVGVESEVTIDRNEYGIGSDWRHTLIPSFIGDEVGVEIFLWTRPGEPLEPENERNER
jgi:polyisoprenoid-binding protein YceI